MKRKIKVSSEPQLLEFVNLMNTFTSHVDLSKGCHSVDAKSILGVIALGIYDILEIELLSANEDEIVRFEREIKKYERLV